MKNSVFDFFSSVSKFLLLTIVCSLGEPALAQKDVINIVSYNVLKYGNGCQGPNSETHSYLKTIVKYTNPDILGLIKVETIATKDKKGRAPIGFADSILRYALNAAFPGRYNYCPFSNKAKGNDENVLFYNQQKFGFSSMVTLVSDLTDFDMFKLYYRDVGLSKLHDTMFLYIVLVHAESGDKPDDRDRQLAELMIALSKQFNTLPGMVIMGDFNIRKTKEEGYQSLVKNAEEKYRFLDAPFGIDKDVSYPSNWDKHPERFAAFLTTSTRKKQNEPNDCGTGGGAKAWYDHMFLSPSLTGKADFCHYVHHSYRTVGNDGKRINRSVNDMPNASAPADVLNALYHMSNKYPIKIELEITKAK